MAADGEGTGLASSLTDLMTSLAVIFILLLVASHNNEQQELEAQHDDLASQQEVLARTQAALDEARRELAEAKEKTGTTRTQILVALQKALESFRAEGVRAETDPRDPLGLLVIVQQFPEESKPQVFIEISRLAFRKPPCHNAPVIRTMSLVSRRRV